MTAADPGPGVPYAAYGIESSPTDLDLGHGHRLRFVVWAPDRELNPQRAHLPDVPRYGALIWHPRRDTGSPCLGSITFAGPVQQEIDPDRPVWTVESWEPLTISPSVLCRSPSYPDNRPCNDHGFIRGGCWVPA